jgi:DNA polymerase-3 subunit beta
VSATVSAARLKEAAAWAGRAISARPAAPVMAGAVLEIQDDQFTASGWDFDTHASITLDADGHLPRTLVSGRLLAEVTSRMTGQAKLGIKDSRLVISTAATSVRLPIMAESEYPHVPAKPNPAGVCAGLGDGIRRVAPTADKDGAKELAFLNLAVRNGSLAISARNTAMMSQALVDWDGEVFEANPDASRILDLARHMDGKVSIGFDNMLWLADDSRIAAHAVHDKAAANFAALDGVDRWSGFGYVDIDRADLLASLADVQPVLPSAFGTVGLAVGDGEFLLRAMRTEVGDASSRGAANLDGEAREVVFQAAVLATALNGLDHHEVVRLSFGPTVTKSVLITGVVDDAPDLATRHIIQPIRL